MTENQKPTLALVPAPDVPSEIGIWLTALREHRSQIGSVRELLGSAQEW